MIITFKLFSATTSDLVQTHSDVESVKNELNELKGIFLSSLANVTTAVDNIKKDMNGKFLNLPLIDRNLNLNLLISERCSFQHRSNAPNLRRSAKNWSPEKRIVFSYGQQNCQKCLL